MKRILLLALLVVPLACSVEPKAPPTRTYVTKMVIDDGKESTLECDTGRWNGKITLQPDVKVGYRNVTTTGATPTESKTTLTLNGVVMTVELDGLRFGSETFLKLNGESAVDVRSDGIYVKGSKFAALPAN